MEATKIGGVFVETYEVEETAASEQVQPEVTEAVSDLVNSLGLEGQKKLYAGPQDEPAEEGGVATVKGRRVPYRMIRKDEVFVYNLLCPAHTDVEEFSREPIPLRVLEVLAYAKELDFFTGFEIWSVAGPVKDPILVGWKTPDGSKSAWSREYFPLARWGAELDEWGILCKKALALWREKAETALAKGLAKLSTEKAAIEAATLNMAMENPSGCTVYNTAS